MDSSPKSSIDEEEIIRNFDEDRDSNLFNNIVKCLRKVTRVDLDKVGRADPIQRFVNKTTDEMTQDICFLMDEVTSNLDSMYTEIKHIFNYYNAEMEKIASKFHEKNVCQNDAGKLQAELVKSVTDLNFKAESLKCDLQAQQSEFQKYIHDYILTLQEKSERNYQILNKLKIKQHSVTDKDTDSESIKDMIENYSKSSPLRFTSASMSSNGMFSSIDSQIPSTSRKGEYQNQSKLDLENTSRNLEEICKKLKMTTKNLEHKSEEKSELTSETNSHLSDLKKKLESSNNNLNNVDNSRSQKVILAITNNLDSENNEKFNIIDKNEIKSQINNAKKSEEGLKSFKISDKRMPSHRNDIPILEEEEGEVSDRNETRKRKSDNVNKVLKSKSNDESKLLKKKESVKAFKLPQKSKSEKSSSDFKISANNSKLEVSKAEALENMPNKMEKKLNELNVLLSQTQSLNVDEDKDSLISRTSSLPDDPSDTKKLFDIKIQSLHNDSSNKNFDRFEYRNKLASKNAHFSTSDTYLKRKIPWHLQSTTNFQSSTNENVPPTCDGPTPTPPPTCCVATPPPPPPMCPCAPDICDDPCNPCEKDESHGSVKYDLFEAYLCSKPKATRYMDYLDSVKKGLKEQDPNAGVCNQFIMSHTEFLEAIDTRKKLLKSIEKHRESQVECLEPSKLAKLKAIVTCKLGRLKSCSAVAKPETQQQQLALTDQSKYPHELGVPSGKQHQYNLTSSQSAVGQQFYLESQQNIKSLPAGEVPAIPYTFTPTPTSAAFPQPATMPEHSIHSTSQPAVESVLYNLTENQPPAAASYEHKTATQSQPTHDLFSYSEPQPVVTQEPHSTSISSDFLKPVKPVHIHENLPVQESAQRALRQEQYSNSEAEPTVRQKAHNYSEAQISARQEPRNYSEPQTPAKQEPGFYAQARQSANQYQHQEAQSSVKQELQQATGNEQHSSQAESAVRQEQYSQYAHSEAHRSRKQEYAETQYTVAQQQNNFPKSQPVGTQGHQHTSTTCSKQALHVAKDQYTPSHTLPETELTAIREPYNHFEIQNEEKFEASSPQPIKSHISTVAQQPEETYIYPAPSLYTPHSQTPPPTPEKFIYPEMRPFEQKSSPMRQHIEQKIAEAAKPIIETPYLLKPIKPTHLHENIPGRKSETLPESNNKTNSTETSSTNSNQEYTSETTSLSQSNTYDRSKYTESSLGPRRRSFTKFEVNRNSLKVTPAKRSTFK